jgi:hypothetical protein
VENERRFASSVAAPLPVDEVAFPHVQHAALVRLDRWIESSDALSGQVSCFFHEPSIVALPSRSRRGRGGDNNENRVRILPRVQSLTV